ncbi:hypothetical protein ACGF0D_41345 [Kitasatospora sp. NPDC048298]|uniref:hypothetical protein n=1 Tax=Kitasatospora sp. NPDC048298 TaxID=3364049 RepID=UPI0037135757
MDTPEPALLVRETVGAVLGTSLHEWPADRPLAELPDAIYDSLAQLEVLTRLERALRLRPRPVEPHRLATVEAILGYLAEAPRATTGGCG